MEICCITTFSNNNTENLRAPLFGRAGIRVAHPELRNWFPTRSGWPRGFLVFLSLSAPCSCKWTAGRAERCMGTELVKIWSFGVFTSETKDNEKQGKEPFSLAYMQLKRLKNERHFSCHRRTHNLATQMLNCCVLGSYWHCFKPISALDVFLGYFWSSWMRRVFAILSLP